MPGSALTHGARRQQEARREGEVKGKAADSKAQMYKHTPSRHAYEVCDKIQQIQRK